MNKTLYDITSELRAAMDALEIDEETGEILNADELDAATNAFDDKVDGVACYIKELDALAEGIHKERMNLADRERVTANKAARLKDYLANCLDAAGRSKFESERNRLSFRRSKRIDIIDESKLPEDFVVRVETTRPDKKAIKDAIESGEEVNGAALVINRSLQIK